MGSLVPTESEKPTPWEEGFHDGRLKGLHDFVCSTGDHEVSVSC